MEHIMRKPNTLTPKSTVKKREVLSRDERIRAILEASQRVFSSRPYDAISIDDIAAEASMSKGLLYHYFTDKRDLYLDTLRSVFAVTSQIPKDCPDLRSCLDDFLTYFERQPALVKMIFRGGIGSDVEVQAILDDYHQRQFEIFFESIPGSATNLYMKLALRGWISFFLELCLQWIEHPEDVSRDQVLRLLEKSLQFMISSTTP
jgi:AcrR family transcriptional regulator